MPGGTRDIHSASEGSSRAPRFLILALLICLLTLIVFFRDFFLSGFNLIAGDTVDNRFIIAMLEHWRAVTRGQAAFTSPNFFWPVQGVLGYNESMFLMSWPYMIGAFTGLDRYLAFEMAFIVFKAIGFFSMLWLLRSVLGMSRAVALIGAAVFTLSNLYFISVEHAGLATVVFTPLAAALACSAWREYGNGRMRIAHAYGAACGVLTALVLFTSFYIGWFTILAGTACIAIAALAGVVKLQAVFARRWLLGVAALAFIVAMTPFLVTYIPTLKHTGGQTFTEYLTYSAGPLDVVNVGSGNWMWSRALKPVLAGPATSSLAAAERTVGWPPVILLLTLAGAAVSLIQLLGTDRTDTARHRAQLSIVICSASFLCLWTLSIHVGGWSLWWLVLKFVPGSLAIRMPVRLNMVLNVLLVLSACLILEQFRDRRNRILRVVFWGVAVLLVAEQINITHTHEIDRAAENALLARVKRPPADCASFFFTAPAQPQRTSPANQIDAMLVARAANLPTLNGYSGRFPPDWNLLTFDNEYLNHAKKWAQARHVEQGLCGLDLRNGSWTTEFDVNNVYAPGQVLDFRKGGRGPRFEGEGWGSPETGGSWTIGGRSVLVLPLPAPPTRDLSLSVEARAFTPPQRSHFDETLMVNGRVAAQFSITDPNLRRRVHLPAELIRSGVIHIEFINHDPRSPADLGVSTDTRQVGLALETLRLDATTYSLGEVLDFRKDGNAPGFEDEGWSDPEQAGSWTVGGRSVLLLQLLAPPTSDLLLSLEAHAFTPPQRSHFDETLMVNGRVAAQWAITDREPVIRRQVRLPAELVSSGAVRIEFLNHDPRSPADLGLSKDTRKVGLALHTLRLDTTGYSPGEVLDFHKGGNALNFEGEGWAEPEPDGSWTIGGHSVLLLQLPAAPTGDLLLSFEAHAFTPPQRSHFDETLMVNGQVAAQWTITDHEPDIRRRVRLPAELPRSRVVRIEFVNHDPRSPADLGLSTDTRKVGLALHTLRLDTTAYSPGEVVDFRKGGNALSFEGEGWSKPEPDGSWTIGDHSVLVLQLPAAPTGDLLLSLEAHAFTPPQRSHFDETLMVNGRVAAQWTITDHEPIIGRRVRLPAELVRSRVVRIEFINHDPRSPADLGVSSETRKVGLALHTLRLESTASIPQRSPTRN